MQVNKVLKLKVESGELKALKAFSTFLLTGIACLLFSSVSAQKADSARKADSVKVKPKKVPYPYPNPKVAFLCSTLVPGLGQVYDKTYWKIPIIYAGLGAAVYYINKNEQEYNMYNNALVKRSQGGIDPYYNIYSPSQLASIINKYEGYKALAITGAVGMYLFNIVDADIYAQIHRVKPHKPITVPQRAMLYSAVCPGLGQIYNKKYWKLPILYAGMGTAIYFLIFNQHNYNYYNNLLNQVTINPSSSIYSSTEIASLVTYYHQDRDLSVIIAVGVYLLSIVDANVDAQMHNFNVSDDISMKLSPNILPNPITGGMSFTPGLTLTKKF